ncbi:MAG: hypothetical protein ACTHMS_18205 [Jatrophihabitans sp.]|uniref:hypothetical protein n=1 Tax=Jatrophihabitans sp. TaxID=1932789 RepID=UPI003F81E432
MTDRSPLVQKHGSAKHPERPVAHQRPDGVTDIEAEALGKLGEALEAIEAARGFLYNFHRLSGTADLTLQDAVELLRKAGHGGLADEIEEVLVGRDVIAGRWTFQLVEDYDQGYYDVFKDVEHHARAQIGVPDPHLYEAEMKHQEQQPKG